MKQATGGQAKVEASRDRDQVATSSDVRQGYPNLKELKAMSREDFDAWWRAVTASEDEIRGWMSSVGLKTLSELAPMSDRPVDRPRPAEYERK